MKTIKYTILFITFVVGLYYSQSVTILAHTIWNLLYGNHVLFSFYFIFITLIYLLFIYSYFNLLNINKKLIKFLLNKLSFYNLLLLVLNIIYDLYYYLFQFIKPLLILYISKIFSSKIIFNYFKKYLWLDSFIVRIKHSLPFITWRFPALILGTDIENNNTFLRSSKERLFITSLIKKAYTYPVFVKCYDRSYRLSLHETLLLLDSIDFKFRSTDFNLFSKLMKLIKFVDETSYVYEALLNLDQLKYNNSFYGYEFMICSKKKIRKLVLEEAGYFINDSKKIFKIKLLKIINNNPLAYRLFVLMCIHKYFIKIKALLTKKKLIISIDPKLLAQSGCDFYKLEYNLFYLYQKEVNLNHRYFRMFISEFFKEIKVMFQFIKYFIFIYFLMLIINPIFITYFIIIILCSSLIIQYFQKKNYKQSQLFKYKIYRLIYYKICYSLNLLILTNSLYLILINYLILTLILILIVSLIRILKYPFDQFDDHPFLLILSLFQSIKNPFYYFYVITTYHINKFKLSIINFILPKLCFKKPMNSQILRDKIIKFLNKN